MFATWSPPAGVPLEAIYGYLVTFSMQIGPDSIPLPSADHQLYVTYNGLAKTPGLTLTDNGLLKVEAGGPIA